MLNFSKYLKSRGVDFIFLVNEHPRSLELLVENNISFELVDFKSKMNWETEIVNKHEIRVWINDRLDTSLEHAKKLRSLGVHLVHFDDFGSGSELSHLNICGLVNGDKVAKGERVLEGVKYLILNEEIKTFRRERVELKNIIVSMGGSDTYGVTLRVLNALKELDIKATLHLGPSFEHEDMLSRELDGRYKVMRSVPSLMKAFDGFDLAITGGGVTPFEANALGLPCLIIANEVFEVGNAKYLEGLKSSLYLGYHGDFSKLELPILEDLNIVEMSRAGMFSFELKAEEEIFKAIQEL